MSDSDQRSILEPVTDSILDPKAMASTAARARASGNNPLLINFEVDRRRGLVEHDDLRLTEESAYGVRSM
jgi:hypothetical protein